MPTMTSVIDNPSLCGGEAATQCRTLLVLNIFSAHFPKPRHCLEAQNVSFSFCFISIFIQIAYFTNEFSGKEQCNIFCMRHFQHFKHFLEYCILGQSGFVQILRILSIILKNFEFKMTVETFDYE